MRVNTTDLQKAFGKYLALAQKEDIIVVKNGKSVAKITKHSDPDHLLIHEGAKKYKSCQRVSLKEYEELISTSDERYELIEGEIYLLPSPSYQHQVVVNEISWHLNNFFRDKPCQLLASPVDIRLSGYAAKFEEDPNIVQPDLAVICDPEQVRDGKYFGVPSLMVEVLSPSTQGKDRATKLLLYMKSGIQEYWIVDIENKVVLFYTFSQERDIENAKTFGADETVCSGVFPGLELKVEDILARVQ